MSEIEDIDFLLMRYVLGEMNDDEKVLVREWIAADEKHAEYYKDFQMFHLKMEWGMRANAVVHDSLVRRRVKARQRRLRVLYWSVACLIVLFSVGGILWMLPEDEPVYVTEKIEPGKSKAVLYMASGDVVNVDGQTGVMKEKDGTRIEIDGKEGIAYRVTGGQQQEETLSNRIVIPRGGEFKLILADGTAVWLNSDSELSYPTAFAGQKREVFLRGEAYFDVKPDSLHPFIVHVDEVRIQVLGTQFNINTYAEGSIKTVLVEGSVDLRNRAGEHVVLTPNRMADYRTVEGRFELTDVDVQPHVAWREGNFIFQSESLESIMNKLSVWYDLNVFYANEGLRDIRLSGNLERFSDVGKLFSKFEQISEARFKIQGKNVIISSN
ncbi:FecR domain-containing protein [Butyricimonas paravirosa]|uniref:FecR domain-containing protein n=1 Tax=Butyricimonas paravirosa TaxID=1472417 RepID=UPI00210B717B|nr:FecR domain-containing protein [Butyricimonas paravirosa]MCQ4873074.1 FecR domain-containing protein [Butyricimonas paravirosa]